MNDDQASAVIDFARRSAERGKGPASARRAAANKILQRLIDGETLHEYVVQDDDDGEERLVEVADPLRLIMSEFFGHFGYSAGCEALRAVLETRTAIGDRRGGREARQIACENGRRLFFTVRRRMKDPAGEHNRGSPVGLDHQAKMGRPKPLQYYDASPN
jgi:hypothetical protein